MRKKILVISHDLVKKVNIRIYEELSKNKKLELLCIRPKKLFFNKKYISHDFKKKNSKANIIEVKTIFGNLRFLYFIIRLPSQVSLYWSDNKFNL